MWEKVEFFLKDFKERVRIFRDNIQIRGGVRIGY